jgi:hypothetical protein
MLNEELRRHITERNLLWVQMGDKSMPRRVVLFLCLASSILGGSATRAEESAPYALKVPAPAFAGIDEWVNSRALDWKGLKGKVVVVHFWAFG